MPATLREITGGLYCSGGAADNTTDFILGSALDSVATDSTDPTTGQVGFVIVDYPSLSSLEFPQLEFVGSDFIIAKDPKLAIIEFPKLAFVQGNVDITGNIQSVDLPALLYVGGNVNIQTSYINFVCPPFTNTTILGGLYNCSIGSNNPEPLSEDDSSINPSAVNVISVATESSSGPTSNSSTRPSSVISTVFSSSAPPTDVTTAPASSQSNSSSLGIQSIVTIASLPVSASSQPSSSSFGTQSIVTMADEIASPLVTTVTQQNGGRISASSTEGIVGGILGVALLVCFFSVLFLLRRQSRSRTDANSQSRHEQGTVPYPQAKIMRRGGHRRQ